MAELPRLWTPDRDEPNDTGWVYFVLAKGTGRVKIGHTTRRLRDRLQGVQNGCPVLLELRGAFEGSVRLEQALHARFRMQRRIGEWFVFKGEVADWLDEMRDSYLAAGLVPAQTTATTKWW